jgi:glutathionylspermidine synthase
MDDRLQPLIKNLDQKLIAAHADDIELFDRLDRLQQDLGVVSDGRPFSRFLRPHFFPRERYAAIVRAAEVLGEAFETMSIAALEHDEIMAELMLTETEERYARVDPGYGGVCNSSRLDAFISGSDFKFLEYNGETPAGITDQIQIERVLSAVPEVGEFLTANKHWLPRPHRRLLDGLVAAYRESGGTKLKPNIAIVDWKGVSTFTEFQVLKEYFETEGHDTLIADPHELEYDGETLRVGEFEVDIFYKRVLIHEFFDRFDSDHPLLRAYRDGNVCMANSFRTKIPHKKASLAVLQDGRFAGLFTSYQHDAIRKHLPWTRRVKESKDTFNGEAGELIDLIRRNRERLILKPNDDYGGSGIIVGWESTESEWDDAIGNALAEPFVVQERAPVEKVLFPAYDRAARMEELLIDFDPFLFRGRVEGGLIRLSSQTLVNVAAGGGEAALVVLEDM